MKKTLKSLLMTGTLGLALLSGCSSKPEDRPNKVTTINYIGNENKRVVEIFYDNDKDGRVDSYVIGPAHREDNTFPDPASLETETFVSNENARKFYEKEGAGKKIGFQYSSDSGSISLGIETKVMTPEMQSKVDAKYATLNADPRKE